MNQKKLILSKYTMGIGDRFGHQGEAQLAAFVEAKKRGIDVVPVWNKSNREHGIVGTTPASVREEADAAVKALSWSGAYHVDADHIQLATVDPYISSSDFFTIDVADSIGKPADREAIEAFVQKHRDLIGEVAIPDIATPLNISEEDVRRIAAKFLLAMQEAGRIYRHITAQRDADSCAFEVSIDETDKPQTPVDMLFILAAIADEGIPVQTIAPKFTGRFNKGVDYVGDVAAFAREFEEDLAVIAYAVNAFGLPANLKLSVHSGSDKFSIYEPIRRAIARFDAGLHIKTAGTTWLEELIGLAESGPGGLAIAQHVYAAAFDRFDELCAPYAAVIDIDRSALPSPAEVHAWSGEQYADAVRHVPDHSSFNPNVRQLLHVGYKVAAGMGDRYYAALKENRETIARNVTTNILERHLLRVFG
ncbi:MAG: tagaturonate epimerase family protein [Spirochaetaceae bacterium]